MGLILRAATAGTGKAFDGAALAPSSGAGFLNMPNQTKRRTRDALLRLYEEYPWVRLAGDVVAARQSAASWYLLLPKQDARGASARRRVLASKAWDRGKSIKRALEAQELEEVTDHPFLNMMAQGTAGAPPWLELPGTEVDKLERHCVDLIGEWHEVLFRDPEFGHPVAWWPIPAPWITPPSYERPYFEVRVRGRGIERLPPEDVWWYRTPRPSDFYSGDGTGIGGAVDHDIQQDQSLSIYLNSLMRNRARPDLLVALRGLGQPDEERLEEKFRAETSGSYRAGVTHFIGIPLEASEGKGDPISVKELARSPADLEANMTAKEKRDKVLQVWRVPQVVIGATESANRATSYMGNQFIRENRTVPDLESRRSALQYRFFEPRGGNEPEYPGGWILCYRLPPLLDIETRVELMKSNGENFSENDFRRTAGLEPVEGGDERRWVGPDSLLVEDDQLGDLMEIYRGERV